MKEEGCRRDTSVHCGCYDLTVFAIESTLDKYSQGLVMLLAKRCNMTMLNRTLR